MNGSGAWGQRGSQRPRHSLVQALPIQDWNVRGFPCLHLLCAPLLPHNMVAGVIPGASRRVPHSSDKREKNYPGVCL